MDYAWLLDDDCIPDSRALEELMACAQPDLVLNSLVVSSSDDESIHIYSAVTGKSKTKVYSKKYGVDLVRFTRINTRVLSASKNGWDESLRYLNIGDNRYIRYFKGHRDRVVSLTVSHTDESFLSASLDRTVRIWDLRTPSCQGAITRSGRMAVSLDPSGLIFAVTSATNTISLYDKRNFDVGPFKSWQVDQPAFEWRTLEFSCDGQQILLLTTNGLAFMVDAFSGSLIKEFKAREPDEMIVSVNFTPNTCFVVGGTSQGRIYAWRIQDGKEIIISDSFKGPITALKWNPKYLMFAASGDTDLGFWLPAKQLVNK